MKTKTKQERIAEQVEVFVDCSGKQLKVLVFEKSEVGDAARFTIKNDHGELVTYFAVPVETPASLVKIFRKNGILDQISEEK